MSWDTERTKSKIVEAATEEFVAYGPAGTTIEKIARRAGVNKERIYNYFGKKDDLFEHVLRLHVTDASLAVPIPASGPTGIGDYAGRLFDYLSEQPHLLRLLQWEALTVTSGIPDESRRTAIYAQRTHSLAVAQDAGVLTDDFDPDVLNVLILAVVGYWALLPQVVHMMTGQAEGESTATEYARRRAAVVEAARRLAEPQPK